MRRLFMAVIAMATMAAPAMARELPPWVYEQAREGAGTVVVLRVTSVTALPPGQPRGACTLQGDVEAVERGAVAIGQEVTLAVPCIGPDYEGMPGPFPGYDQVGLMSVQRVRVWMTGGRLVQRGLDAITEQPA